MAAVRGCLLALAAAALCGVAFAATENAVVLKESDGNLQLRVPAGKGFSVLCPDEGTIACTGPNVRIEGNACVPVTPATPALTAENVRDLLRASVARARGTADGQPGAPLDAAAYDATFVSSLDQIFLDYTRNDDFVADLENTLWRTANDTFLSAAGLYTNDKVKTFIEQLVDGMIADTDGSPSLGQVLAGKVDTSSLDAAIESKVAGLLAVETSALASALASKLNQAQVENIVTTMLQANNNADSSSSVSGVLATSVLAVAAIAPEPENCKFGDCSITIVTKPMGNNRALVEGFPIYRCRFTSQFLAAPLLTVPLVSTDGISVVCPMPESEYPGGLATNTLELAVDLMEGAVSGSNGHAIPWGHGGSGEVFEASRTIRKTPWPPTMDLAPVAAFYQFGLPDNNQVTVDLSVADQDTGPGDLTVTLITDLDATVAQIGNTYDWQITISNVDDGSSHYTKDILVTVTDNSGASASKTVSVSYTAEITADVMPEGSTVQLVSQFQNMMYDLSVPSYGNNIANFRPTNMEVSITTRRDNSKILVQAQFVMASHSGSHVYTDIWRKVGNGAYTSLARALGGSDTDGLTSEHPPTGGHAWYEQAKPTMALDEPNVPKGTVITYKVYVGLWSGSTVTMGSHRNGNNNGNAPEHFVVEEVASGPCTAAGAAVPCVGRHVMPIGSYVQTVGKWQNAEYDIGVPSYNSNIDNFRPTNHIIEVTTKLDNSKILVHTQLVMAAHSGSHNYVDIWRKIGDDGEYTSLARALGGSDTDGLISQHPASGQSAWYEQLRQAFALDDPQVAAGTKLTYKVYVGLWTGSTVTFGGHRTGNQNGNAPEFFLAREIVGQADEVLAPLPASELPSGSVVQTVSRWQNDNYDVSVPSYGNNIDNFRGTTMEVSITTSLANSKIFVQSMFVMAPHSGSHVYVDIFRKIGNGAYESLSRKGASDADGMISEHPQSHGGAWYERPYTPYTVDSPQVAAGTIVTYKVYVGLWSGSTVTFGSHRSNNNNGRSPEHWVVQEIAA